jgi:hypothetical protein
MLKNPTECEGDVWSAKLTAVSLQVSSDSLLGVSAGGCWTSMVATLETETREEARAMRLLFVYLCIVAMG